MDPVRRKLDKVKNLRRRRTSLPQKGSNARLLGSEIRTSRKTVRAGGDLALCGSCLVLQGTQVGKNDKRVIARDWEVSIFSQGEMIRREIAEPCGSPIALPNHNSGH